MNKRWNDFIIYTVIFCFMSEISCIILFECFEDSRIALVAVLNAGFSVMHIYMYNKIKKDLLDMSKKRIIGFFNFCVSIIITGYTFDLIKIVLEELQNLPFLLSVIFYMVVCTNVLPALWMFYNLFLDPKDD